MIRTFGGYEEAERQIAAFLPDALSYDYGENEELFLSMYPIRCIRISPCSGKFSEALTHRDYLGALIHLGNRTLQTWGYSDQGPGCVCILPCTDGRISYAEHYQNPAYNSESVRC